MKRTTTATSARLDLPLPLLLPAPPPPGLTFAPPSPPPCSLQALYEVHYGLTPDRTDLMNGSVGLVGDKEVGEGCRQRGGGLALHPCLPYFLHSLHPEPGVGEGFTHAYPTSCTFYTLNPEWAGASPMHAYCTLYTLNPSRPDPGSTPAWPGACPPLPTLHWTIDPHPTPITPTASSNQPYLPPPLLPRRVLRATARGCLASLHAACPRTPPAGLPPTRCCRSAPCGCGSWLASSSSSRYPAGTWYLAHPPAPSPAWPGHPHPSLPTYASQG